MQFFSFDFGDPTFDLRGWDVSCQVITFENTYGIDPEALDVDGDRANAGRLTWAGGQETHEGAATIEAGAGDLGTTFDVSAEHTETIRCTKLVLEGLPTGEAIGTQYEPEEIDESGTILSYPGIGTPLPMTFLKVAEDEHLFFRSQDEAVRPKRFAFYERDGATTVELIHEEKASGMGRRVDCPTWEVGRVSDPREVVDVQKAQMERAHDIDPWEERSDVPDWMHEVCLVAALHGMHWSGHVFNTYDDMVEALRWLAERIDPEQVLVYLPGWDGRYYWDYGEYGPAERLGGEDGFARLVDYAQDAGFHLCPMFGIHCANESSENFERWGEPSYLESAGGYRFQGNKPDWDASRARDGGWQAWLNVGAPGWRTRLVEEVSDVVGTYDLDAVFFDTLHVWENDPNHPMDEGLLALRDDLHERFPDLLLTGEAWYDLIGAVTPVVHAGTPTRFEDLFFDYGRAWGHLSYPDPSRGSTGVHEAGYREFEVPDEPEETFIPTLTVVDGTLEETPEEAEAVVDLAKAYSDEFL